MQQVCNEDHSDSDCVVVVVLTHGDGHNLWAKNVKYPTETLFEYFNGNRCPTLIGKPKIFIIQACRGGKVDPGSTLRALGPTPAFTSAPTTPQRIYTIPTNADFLVYYSTSPGHYSFRNPVTGSYFIDNLVYILNNCCYNGNYQYNHDLVTLFTLVNQLVAIKFESHNSKRPEIHGKKQMPV
ncbi:unnamed protein product [Medioppia subpectinata]|uniref:Uncharacterized protein n=1 Tax=Medioppia subpectinata TaxID=1979941 RepID=A0A7R9L3E9_9ACAR|nr:unnamed protein product [Medioppia subpectinata]CAG2114575.1 unnamed protein product [Medioppia subpectinata]